MRERIPVISTWCIPFKKLIDFPELFLEYQIDQRLFSRIFFLSSEHNHIWRYFPNIIFYVVNLLLCTWWQNCFHGKSNRSYLSRILEPRLSLLCFADSLAMRWNRDNGKADSFNPHFKTKTSFCLYLAFLFQGKLNSIHCYLLRIFLDISISSKKEFWKVPKC